MKGTQDYGVTAINKRQPAKQAPYAYQTKTTPSTYTVGGKIAVRGSNVSGGNMNSGSKHRPGKRA